MTTTTSTTASRRSRSHASRAADQITAPTAEQLTAVLTAAGVSEADQQKMIKSVQPKPPKFNVKRHVAAELVRVAGDLAESWNPDDHEGISQEVATQLLCQRLSYGPVGVWDERLGERSDAGRKPKPDESESE